MNKKPIRTALALTIAAGVAVSGYAGFTGSANAASSITVPIFQTYTLGSTGSLDLSDLLKQLKQNGIQFPSNGTVTLPVLTCLPIPTKAPVPTNAPIPTKAPVPTYAPIPTKAPLPTNTPVPTKAPVPTASPTPAPNQGDSAFAEQVVNLVNQERAKQGLGALSSDSLLTKVALDKAKDMYNNNYFDHNSPTYGSPFNMMKSYGVKYSYAGENIAKGQRTPQEVMNAWMNSSGHRANILGGNYTKIGVAYYNGEWVQEFTG